MFNKDLAIDLGSSNMRIFMPGKGIVIDEPSVITLDNLSGKIISVGKQACSMIGKTSKRFSVIHPIVRGVLSDFELAEQLIDSFVQQIYSNKVIMPRVVATIPSRMTEVEKRAVVNSISTVGVRKICLIESPIAAAMGADIDVFSPTGSLVIDAGSDVTDIAVITLSGTTDMYSLKLGGSDIDSAIVKYIRKNFGLIIGVPMAEKVKILVGGVTHRETPLSCVVKGKDIITGIPKKATVSSDEIYPICKDVIMPVVKTVCELLENTKPELVGDISERGITLTGGLSKLYGLDKIISEATNLNVNRSAQPELCSVLGAGKAIEFIDKLSDQSYIGLNPLLAEY